MAIWAWSAQSMASHVTRSCQPRLGHFPETVEQGGVARLLPGRRGTGEGGELGLVAVFDGCDGAPVIGGGSGDVLQQGEATGKVRGEPSGGTTAV
jgi:hypothetical protein